MHKNKIPFPLLHQLILVSHYLRQFSDNAPLIAILFQTKCSNYEVLDCFLPWMGAALSSEAAISEPRT